MKYAFFPGCVSQGGAPELYPAARMVCDRLGIELEEIPGWTCTGGRGYPGKEPALWGYAERPQLCQSGADGAANPDNLQHVPRGDVAG